MEESCRISIHRFHHIPWSCFFLYDEISEEESEHKKIIRLNITDYPSQDLIFGIITIENVAIINMIATNGNSGTAGITLDIFVIVIL